MKKCALIMSIIFMIFTFAGAGYVLINHGKVNAGYAVVPMAITMVWLSVYCENEKIKMTNHKQIKIHKVISDFLDCFFMIYICSNIVHHGFMHDVFF